MEMDKNTILAIVLSGVVLIGWLFIDAKYIMPKQQAARAQQETELAKEQAEKERKANEAAANQALKDQLAARASLSNEGNAGQNPPVYSEMANVITPSSGTGNQAAKNTGSSANGTSSDSKHK